MPVAWLHQRERSFRRRSLTSLATTSKKKENVTGTTISKDEERQANTDLVAREKSRSQTKRARVYAKTGKEEDAIRRWNTFDWRNWSKRGQNAPPSSVSDTTSWVWRAKEKYSIGGKSQGSWALHTSDMWSWPQTDNSRHVDRSITYGTGSMTITVRWKINSRSNETNNLNRRVKRSHSRIDRQGNTWCEEKRRRAESEEGHTSSHGQDTKNTLSNPAAVRHGQEIIGDMSSSGFGQATRAASRAHEQVGGKTQDSVSGRENTLMRWRNTEWTVSTTTLGEHFNRPKIGWGALKTN